MTLKKAGYLVQIRNGLLVQLLRDRPEINYTEAGSIFGISRQMVSKIVDKRGQQEQ
jgi:hypothetical protein